MQAQEPAGGVEGAIHTTQEDTFLLRDGDTWSGSKVFGAFDSTDRDGFDINLWYKEQGSGLYSILETVVICRCRVS